MADGAPTRLKREPEVRRALPYARHLSPEIIALDSGALMLCLKLDGVSFETADVRDLNDWHVKLNQAWRNLADERLALWHHVVRRPVRIPPTTGHRSQFARELAAAYDARLARGRLFVNDLYLTLVLHPGRRPGDRAGGLLRRVRGRGGAVLIDDGPLRRLEDAARDLVQLLERYGPRRLALYEANGLWFSEPLEMIRLILTGRPSRVPLTCGHLGEAVYTVRAIFGRETLELRDVADARFAGVLALKEYPSVTRPGLWDGLLDAPFAFVISQSFAFLSKPAARAVLERKQNQMVSARDRAASQIDGLDSALDDLVSNRFVMGEHHASMLVYGDDPAQLADHLSRARGLLAESGLVVVREDLGLEAAFWSQVPGVFARRTRPAAVPSRNFAALHVGDLGHTFICGPSGSGKTVVQNFLLAQMERFSAQQVFIDKDRGAEIFVRACGGDYLALKPGEPTGFAPFRALESTPANRAFLARLVRAIAARPDAPFTVGQLRAVEDAVMSLEALPRSRRSLGALRALLGQGDAGGLGARLERWTADGPLGWVLDNPHDAVALDAPLAGFDVTTILDDPEVRAPVMLYLLHRIGQRVDGRRFVLDIDEFWTALGDPAFTDLIRDGLKTWRKQNALMMFGTQSPADALASPIAPAILEQCATKIFLPNAHGQARDYVDGFGLSQTEFRLIRDELTPESHRFLIKQGHTSVVAELDLGGMDEALAVLSGRAETTALLDRLRAEHGDAYADWGPAFHRQRSLS